MLILKTMPRETNLSKGELNKMRKEGRIPACLYGSKTENTNLLLNTIDFEKVFATEGKVFQIEVGKRKVLINAKEIQREPVNNNITHISFVELVKGETTSVIVPLHTTGEAIGEKSGGNVVITHEKIKIDGVPSKIPSFLEIDVTNLNLNETLHAKDIKLPKGIVLHSSENPDQGVASCIQSNQSKSDDKPAEQAAASSEEETKTE